MNRLNLISCIEREKIFPDEGQEYVVHCSDAKKCLKKWTSGGTDPPVIIFFDSFRLGLKDALNSALNNVKRQPVKTGKAQKHNQ